MFAFVPNHISNAQNSGLWVKYHPASQSQNFSKTLFTLRDMLHRVGYTGSVASGSHVQSWAWTSGFLQDKGKCQGGDEPEFSSQKLETENILSCGCPSCHLPFCLKETEPWALKLLVLVHKLFVTDPQWVQYWNWECLQAHITIWYCCDV